MDEQVVCPRNVVTKTVGPFEEHAADKCISGCTYFEDFRQQTNASLGSLITGESLVCELETEANWGWGKYQYCDCPCDLMVDVQAPSVAMTTLAYVAQALVTTIIGLNMAFRCQSSEDSFMRALH